MEKLQDIMKAATNAVGKLMYTTEFDMCSELIPEGADPQEVLECGH